MSEAAARALVHAGLELLARRGLLARPDPRPRSVYFAGYAQPAVHRLLLRDQVRTEAFRRALHQRVRPGDVVLEVGTGTGVLALFAAQAGAARVHAIEASSLASATREVLGRNPGGERVELHEGDAERLELGVSADLLVSEWLGHFALTEAMWPAVVAQRERCLRAGGAIVPTEVELFLAPVGHPELLAWSPSYWGSRPYGLDLRPLAAEELARPHTLVGPVPAAALLAEPRSLLRLDCRGAPAEALTFESELAWELGEDGELQGFAGFFRATLAPGVVLDTGPGAPATHWQQHLFPLPARTVERGERIELRFSARPGARRPRRPEYRLEGVIHGPRRRAEFAYRYDRS